ncbi:hypothetical protein [Planomonospora venezuelensis]|uniref:CBM2 domain-containing protein n=1 Tax=Planomonospora venezuelensis TaxID=1999 RepID=A0A841D3L6_PLAVE|nr:hypothetical protein [Planomonospora venezuelensis]MBB5963094.1 hypothetical protein [Planomonospora venezuelensis]GIN00661.1 hypothetical protein Pve01_23190 [Planomonospora venezuelensis]
MGRHGERGDELPRHRGTRDPEPAPDPGGRGEPAGRRLRPEQSATTGIWPGIQDGPHDRLHGGLRDGFDDGSPDGLHDRPHGGLHDGPQDGPRDGLHGGLRDETRTGFLGSGWSAETGSSGPDRSGGERRSGGWLKAALLAVTAMVAVTGGTVLGVQAWKSPEASVADCARDDCLAGASDRPEPEAGTPEPDGEPVPDEEPVEAEAAQTSPAPAPPAPRRSTGPTRRPSPGPTATRVPQSAETAPPEDEPLPTEEPPEEGSGELIDVDNRSAPTSTPTSAPTSAQPTPVPDATGSPVAETPVPVSAGEAAITVGFGVLKQRSRAYTAELVVAADGRIGVLELSLPVGGEVASVTGARWRQDGGTLVIKSAGELEAGEELVVTFTAYGRAKAPRDCRSAQGDCSVT